MKITDLFNDRTIGAKQKTVEVVSMLLKKELSLEDHVFFSSSAKDSNKATCIEALEYITKNTPSFIDEHVFLFVCSQLAEKAPRVKMESARVIGNTVKFFPHLVEKAIPQLLVNSENTGTVVRWSAAFALGEIYKLKTNFNADLLPTLETIISREDKNSIKKIYLTAIKVGNL